ncbi:DEAD/DEAH box helicase [Brevibacillus dissolubilis]|uniref:DEAD/DEAH box helicase n=1 Tax=Brevibacillus dissolubilis TaxID=1844116 RepID=UPI0011174841|nr:helicase-related protein [Brevibacillus dissolubilis]
MYGKETEQTGQTAQRGIHLYITSCFSVDQLFWREQGAGRLIVLGSSPSLALVFALKERMEMRLAEGRGGNRVDSRILHRLAEEQTMLYNKSVQQLAREKDMGKLPFAFTFNPWSLSDDIHGLGVADQAGGIAQTDDSDEGMVKLEDGHYSFRELEQEAGRMHELLMGRSLLWEEVEFLHQQKRAGEHLSEAAVQWLVLKGAVLRLPGVSLTLRKGLLSRKLVPVCLRCGEMEQIKLTVCHSCRQACAYCTACLQMGRAKCCTPLLCSADHSLSVHHRQPLLQWTGQYSPAQAEVASRARGFVNGDETAFLIWAVCGAGKTELIFPVVEEVLSQGGKVCIATPRKDVVLELAPRLTRVFPDVTTLTIHGSSTEKWEQGELVIATTHQVMRFYRRFALVIVDEVDAFPFHNNHSLYRAVDRAVSEQGKILYLSATPPKYLRDKLVRPHHAPPSATAGQNRLCRLWCRISRLFKIKQELPHASATHVILPSRYHGHPLPVPKTVIVQGWKNKLKSNQPLPQVIQPLEDSLEQERQVFFFVPRIGDVDTVIAYLRYHLPRYAERIEGVHAADQGREEKVLRFRQREIVLLVTTTILERGVTIPRSDCIVLGADAGIFDEASLVQIAGRVGRSANSPGGTILFLMEHRVQAPYQAIAQIKQMNQLASRIQRGVAE